jgi:hypothetical protein
MLLLAPSRGQRGARQTSSKPPYDPQCFPIAALYGNAWLRIAFRLRRSVAGVPGESSCPETLCPRVRPKGYPRRRTCSLRKIRCVGPTSNSPSKRTTRIQSEAAHASGGSLTSTTTRNVSHGGYYNRITNSLSAPSQVYLLRWIAGNS